MQPTPSTLCIFAKPPIAGVAKTRLASAVGLQHSGALATAFFLDTITLCRDAAQEAKRPVSTVLSVTELHPMFRTLAPELPRWPQGEGPLGARLERTIRYALSQRPTVVIVGSDAPHMPARQIVAAMDRLAACDVVLTPSDRGGISLIGARVCLPGMLNGIGWSAGAVLGAVCERLATHRLSFAVMEPCFDVDDAPDLERLSALLAMSPERAPQTARAIRRLVQRRPIVLAAS
jgi:glycosyltransferase A (GT-A) superfamily protein (DUF2064 family)